MTIQKNLKNALTANNALRCAAVGLSLTAGSSLNALVLEDELTAIFKEGKASLNMRARYEHVNAGATDVDGYSLRTRVGYTTAAYNGFKASIEAEDISFVDNSNRPGLDVPTTELNQFWLSYSNDAFGSAKVGRQVYTLDDHRFIGHVGWRQNIQSFDAATVNVTAVDNASFKLAYLTKVNRINATTQNLDGALFNASFKPHKSVNLTAFAYLLEFDRAALMSSDTFGFRANGVVPIDDFKIKYAASYAIQTDNDGNPTGTDFDLSYYSLDLGGSFMGFSIGGGLEVLEGDGTFGFSTPLATVHKFNGWADVFAGRSLGLAGGLPQGLEDYYINIGYKIPVGNGINLKGIYHWFEAEATGEELGTEIDFVASYKINKYLTVLSKYAFYETENPTTTPYGGTDTTVFTLEMNFKY